jgi:shikimate dehydrogenase
MHNAAFRAMGLDAVCLAFDVRPEALAAAVTGARALSIRQLAISLPHKVTVLKHLDEVESVARCIGAVNTATWRDGRLVGSNTDWIGAVGALERETPLRGKRAVVLGAGGTARAVVYGLHTSGAQVTVLNRTPSRAQALADEFGAAGAGSLEELARTPCEILVNTTSVGLRSDASPLEPSAIPGDAVVMDAVYDPEQTRLLRDAAARGAQIVTGKWMLVHQAAEQVRLWTGLEPPVDVMAQAFEEGG